MNRVVLALVVTAALLASALGQTYVEAWVVEQSEDPFTDERQATLLTGTDGAFPADSEAVLGLLCRDGVLHTVLVQFDRQLDTGVMKEFDYRLDGGAVQTGQAWADGRGMGVSAEADEESFAALSEALLSGGAQLAVRVSDSRGEPRTAVFLLEGLQEALDEAACSRGA